MEVLLEISEKNDQLFYDSINRYKVIDCLIISHLKVSIISEELYALHDYQFNTEFYHN